MIRRLVIVILLLATAVPIWATADSIMVDRPAMSETLPPDSIVTPQTALQPTAPDCLVTSEATVPTAMPDSLPQKKGFLKRPLAWISKVLKNFNDPDTTFIEPQRYKFTATLMSTYSFENYSMRSKLGQEINFSPEARIQFGPYIGWSFLFWGYTIDLAYFDSSKKKSFDLSVYTSRLGADFFLRRSGKDYKIRSIDLGEEEDFKLKGDIPFDGLSVSITGLNVYYITNHHRYSYPAAFNQSTCQRRSAGSFMFGGGYTRHSLELNLDKLLNTLSDVGFKRVELIDSVLGFGKVKYTDISLSAGYGYNWVFAPNWVLAASLSLALGYKSTTGDHITDIMMLRDFSLHNFNVDGVGRFGVIWNDSKWYFGAYSVIHSYNYSKSRFETTNYFGNVKVYVGFNFGRKKSHKH